jgi:hypothetical protein
VTEKAGDDGAIGGAPPSPGRVESVFQPAPADATSDRAAVPDPSWLASERQPHRASPYEMEMNGSRLGRDGSATRE